ncbi:flagellar biosynthetic protein FliO [Shewanella loihica]|uniref:Flagellar protein n=2 Tax=Shewanellaceae TaxID=267890 RepID=A3QCP6_SHELP|nr:MULTISPECIES: flagellar biosynthetic protein FliO [Shewanella]ABO23244.1 flagellar biosynthesis protein, FliO [Shewanella loihica PV-4]KIO36094.1 flagellar biosynthesis protein FliO [Shewanella sp. cp20]QYJ88736.1 flagellar biosynthetic protein FliO [Shewanella halotolerans]QYJ98923.1 flagellar biosynthetic protein FliO [Shewanella alkalitolerans]TVP10175.1 flagellar biosynthesis protein FliO [Shewanella sp. KCT]
MGISSLMAVAAAATTTQVTGERESALATMTNMLGGLLVVIALIFLLAYLVKRLKLVPSSHGVLKTLAVTPLGQREKMVLVEVDGQQYLLGVTPQQVSLIDKLDTPITIEQDSFASRLRQAKSSQS